MSFRTKRKEALKRPKKRRTSSAAKAFRMHQSAKKIQGMFRSYKNLRIKVRSNSMPIRCWYAALICFIVVKVCLLVGYVLMRTNAFAAYGEQFVVPAHYKERGITADIQTTIFHKHAHCFGWSHTIMVGIHVVLAFAAMPIVFYQVLARNFGEPRHIFLGRVFCVIFMITATLGLTGGIRRVVVFGFIEKRYTPEGVPAFSMWLFIHFTLIGNVMCDAFIQALGAIQYKVRRREKWVRKLLIGAPFSSIIFIVYLLVESVIIFAHSKDSSSDAIEYAIVFCITGPLYILLLHLNLEYWWQKRRMWKVEHQRNMIWVANLVVVTGVANIGYKFYSDHSWVVPMLWTIQDIIVGSYAYHLDQRLKTRMRIDYLKGKMKAITLLSRKTPQPPPLKRGKKSRSLHSIQSEKSFKWRRWKSEKRVEDAACPKLEGRETFRKCAIVPDC
eukprot:205081_1